MKARHIPAKLKKDALTDKQRIFAMAYAADPKRDATAAAREAGFAPAYARKISVKWMRLAKVQTVIRAFLDRQAKKWEIKSDRVIHELACSAFSDIANYIKVDAKGQPHFDLRFVTRDQTAAIRQIQCDRDGSFKLQLYDKMHALELLGRYLKMFDKEMPLDAEFKKIIVLDIPRPDRTQIGLPSPHQIAAQSEKPKS